MPPPLVQRIRISIPDYVGIPPNLLAIWFEATSNSQLWRTQRMNWLRRLMQKRKDPPQGNVEVLSLGNAKSPSPGVMEADLIPQLPDSVQRDYASTISNFMNAFQSTSFRERSEARGSLMEWIRQEGGVPDRQNEQAGVTAVLQGLRDVLLHEDYISVYGDLAENDRSNARLAKLLGLHCYWRSFLLNGLKYADEAVVAFAHALKQVNNDKAETPFRVKEWLIKARIVELLVDRSRDEAQLHALVQNLNALRDQFNASVGLAYWNTSATLGNVIDEITFECENDRAADRKPVGEAVKGRIAREVLGAGLDETVRSDNRVGTIWDVTSESSDIGTIWLKFREENDAFRIQMVPFRESPGGGYHLNGKVAWK